MHYSPGLNTVGTSSGLATEATLEEIPGFWIPINDYVAATYPSATQEVYTFKVGGSGGSTVAVVTLNYTDSTKANLLNAAIVRS